MVLRPISREKVLVWLSGKGLCHIKRPAVPGPMTGHALSERFRAGERIFFPLKLHFCRQRHTGEPPRVFPFPLRKHRVSYGRGFVRSQLPERRVSRACLGDVKAGVFPLIRHLKSLIGNAVLLQQRFQRRVKRTRKMAYYLHFTVSLAAICRKMIASSVSRSSSRRMGTHSQYTRGFVSIVVLVGSKKLLFNILPIPG